jgi:hypothetical protein
MVYGANVWNPPRIALCTCGWVGKGKNLKVVNELAEAHVANGCEGCDHAIYIETTILPNMEVRP